jgi:integrase
MGLLRDDPIGGKSIDAVKPSDAKEWAIRMREKGFSYQSISNYKRSLRAALPNITPHSLRHTFCTRMASAGMNPKALQYIMGHANITMTLDYYTHMDACSVKMEMERLAA